MVADLMDKLIQIDARARAFVWKRKRRVGDPDLRFGDEWSLARYEHAYRMRQSGEPWSDVARRLGVTKGRAGQLAWDHWHRTEPHPPKPRGAF